ncbi:MAG: KpsF/GutQ family sugar-phosphate isomerase [Campylobacteraceae bacterium]|jgi:arabinose-5-phosphate isomerase|nr:KpsF/GutQ family sugar-phosphate isomerase [Campylobacteraceae bacterium]
MDFIKIAKYVLELEADELQNAAKRLSNEIVEAVECIYKIKGKLIITGVGKSGLVGAKMAATLASTGTSSFFLHPTEALHGDLGMIGSEDAVLAISFSGESEELIKILPHIKRFNIPLIGMARDKNSSLGRYSDVFLSIDVKKEACPLDAAPTTSTTLTMALGDALAVCLMKKRDFKQADFASFHPGGSLGKRLFIKVTDMMKSKNIPIIKEDCSIKEAIDVMTHGKLGSVLLVDKNRKLVAILSDGDLRRALTNENFSINNRAIDYATKNPKVIQNKNLLASEALEMLEKLKVQLLVVIDEDNVPIGTLHVHDLIEAGIK